MKLGGNLHACEATDVRAALFKLDRTFFATPGCPKFKALILRAQKEGAPVEWIDGGGGGIKLTNNAVSLAVRSRPAVACATSSQKGESQTPLGFVEASHSTFFPSRSD